MLKDPIEIDVLIKELRENNAKWPGEQKPRELPVQPVGKSPELVDDQGVQEPCGIKLATVDSTETDKTAMSWETDPSWVDYTRTVMNKNLSVVPADFFHFDFTEL